MSGQFVAYLQQILSTWPQSQQKTAGNLINKYGIPQEAIPSRLIWYNNGPWKRTILHRDGVPHNFPKPHVDYLAQTVDYRTPVEKFENVAAYDGSVYPDRTKGEVTAACDKEEMNLLSLNLFHEVVTGKRTVEEARAFYSETAAHFLFRGISSPYLERLLFPRQQNTADPDVQTITKMGWE
jgi:hypothetical protein